MPIEHRAYPFNPLGPSDIGACIAVGPHDHDVSVPRVDAALAERLVVDSENPWYSTDGFCLFSKDGTALIRCLTNIETYEVPPTCTRIEDEAFAYNTVIRAIRLHDGMTAIGNRAFIASTLDHIVLPSSLKSIGTEAFAEGKNLETVKIEDGLERIGQAAFYDCAKLRTLHIPRSVTYIGRRAFDQCRIKAHGDHAGLTVSADNERYFIDSEGVLYQRDDDALSLICALDGVEGSYNVQANTKRVLGRAFAFNRKLECIVFPDGLESIGQRAFLECERLAVADLPATVKTIGTEAFYHSALTRLTLPAALEELGPASLIVNMSIGVQTRQTGVGGRGATDFYRSALSGRIGGVSIPRFSLQVSPENMRYVVVGGFLCERAEHGGTLQAVQFVGGGTVAEIPRSITNIAEYALFGVDNVRELHLHTGIEHVGHSALDLAYPIDLIEIDDGNEPPIQLYPAPNSSGTVAQHKAFRAGRFNLDQLVHDCDTSIAFMMPGNERSTRMLKRLANGRMLSDTFKQQFESSVQVGRDELVRHYARIDDRQGIHNLLDLAFIDGSSIAHAIEVANSVKGTSCARLLLEEKRRRFPDHSLNLDL